MQVFKYGKDYLSAHLSLGDPLSDKVKVSHDHLHRQLDQLVSHSRQVIVLFLKRHQAELKGEVDHLADRSLVLPVLTAKVWISFSCSGPLLLRWEDFVQL